MEKFTLQDFEDELKQSVSTEMGYEFRVPPKSAEAFDLEGLQHPLLNPESSHYKVTGEESITLMEKMYSKEDLMTWAKITAMKYALRAGRKNLHGDLDAAILSDIHKKLSYERYYEYLETGIKGEHNDKI